MASRFTPVGFWIDDAPSRLDEMILSSRAARNTWLTSLMSWSAEFGDMGMPCIHACMTEMRRARVTMGCPR